MTRLPRSMALALAVTLPATAQDDLRDRLTLRNGRVVTGRVVDPHKIDELLVLQGGKRVRVDRADVTDMQLVRDRVGEFFARRTRHQKSTKAQRYLVDWAENAELPGLARLQAMALVLEDDSDEQMHRFLGHRQTAKGWLWPNGRKWSTLLRLEAAMLKRPLRLVGERFALSCDAGLLTNVRALLDLEHLGVVWFDRFAKDLSLREVLQPIEVRTFRNPDEFPKWGFRPRPFYEPPPHSDIARTFYAGPKPERPELLFFVGTQGLLYHSMIGEVNQQNSRDRACAWLEIGLGMYMQNAMQGPAGFAAAQKPKNMSLQALHALGRSFRLTHLVHLPMYGSFYLTDDSATASNWSAATMFVTWLLRDDNQPSTRASFLSYVRAALAEGQGDSSTAFDRIMGRRIEQFDEPWLAWLNKLSGN